jgi:hypothetical protein
VTWSLKIYRECIVAFTLQQWSHENAKILLYTYMTYSLYDTTLQLHTVQSNKCPALTQALLAGTLYHRPAQTAVTSQHDMRKIFLNISLAKSRCNSKAILKPY